MVTSNLFLDKEFEIFVKNSVYSKLTNRPVDLFIEGCIKYSTKFNFCMLSGMKTICWYVPKFTGLNDCVEKGGG